eukprot:TRINITY_DN1306_c0_g2_i5.p1 TRINITY_DN1306_c0_g2~~TRINITY_DN1306_c0_g2_i5.p1  ORF type:complete len:253 (-),score=76.87 TRINITY_DN1306_c0_g2_i5:125-883(-)
MGVVVGQALSRAGGPAHTRKSRGAPPVATGKPQPRAVFNATSSQGAPAKKASVQVGVNVSVGGKASTVKPTGTAKPTKKPATVKPAKASAKPTSSRKARRKGTVKPTPTRKGTVKPTPTRKGTVKPTPTRKRVNLPTAKPGSTGPLVSHHHQRGHHHHHHGSQPHGAHGPQPPKDGVDVSFKVGVGLELGGGNKAHVGIKGNSQDGAVIHGGVHVVANNERDDSFSSTVAGLFVFLIAFVALVGYRRRYRPG